jgi:hypothetical protein
LTGDAGTAQIAAAQTAIVIGEAIFVRCTAATVLSALIRSPHDTKRRLNTFPRSRFVVLTLLFQHSRLLRGFNLSLVAEGLPKLLGVALYFHFLHVGLLFGKGSPTPSPRSNAVLDRWFAARTEIPLTKIPARQAL